MSDTNNDTARPWTAEIPALTREEGATVIATVYPANDKVRARIGYDIPTSEVVDMGDECWDADVAAHLVERNRLLATALLRMREAADNAVTAAYTNIHGESSYSRWQRAKEQYDAATKLLPAEAP